MALPGQKSGANLRLCPQTCANPPLQETLSDFRFPPIVLKNSFLAPIRNFAAPWSRQDKIDVGDQQVLRKIR
jgi:hypothetical protein